MAGRLRDLLLIEMTDDTFFRWASGVLLAAALVTSGSYRARADRLGGKLPDRPEGLPPIPVRIGIGLLVWGALLLPILYPPAVRWVTIALPNYVRWLGLAFAALAWPILWWTLASIGTNISPSVSTRANAALITHGPYRWVRHPLYSAGFVAFLGLGLMLGSLVLLAGVAFLLWWLPRRVCREEHHLTASHGDAYREYARRTGRFVPRFSRGT